MSLGFDQFVQQRESMPNKFLFPREKRVLHFYKNGNLFHREKSIILFLFCAKNVSHPTQQSNPLVAQLFSKQIGLTTSRGWREAVKAKLATELFVIIPMISINNGKIQNLKEFIRWDASISEALQVGGVSSRIEWKVEHQRWYSNFVEIRDILIKEGPSAKLLYGFTSIFVAVCF